MSFSRTVTLFVSSRTGQEDQTKKQGMSVESFPYKRLWGTRCISCSSTTPNNLIRHCACPSQ